MSKPLDAIATSVAHKVRPYVILTRKPPGPWPPAYIVGCRTSQLHDNYHEAAGLHVDGDKLRTARGLSDAPKKTYEEAGGQAYLADPEAALKLELALKDLYAAWRWAMISEGYARFVWPG